MPQPSVRSIWLELQIDPNDPELLATLERLVRSGILQHAQVRQLASACLSEDIPWASAPAIAMTAPEDLPQQALPVKRPSPVRTIWHNLRDELSVRWLLFLGVFLVILSSGVLAATQWSRFPAWGQYGLLWLYTIGFWVVGSWARRQEGLRLTANTLQIVTLLLIPVNFWAIDSFQLWQQPLELVTASVAGIGLAGILYLKHQQRRGRNAAHQSGWLLVTYLGLSCLHLGWQISYWSTIAIYIGAIGVAIVLQKMRQIEGGSLAIYGLGILLLRGLVVAHLHIYTFGLAIGIIGWLFTQWGLQKHRRRERLQQVSNLYGSIRTAHYQTTLTNLARLYQQIGAGLLAFGWLMGVADWLSVPKGSSWQAVAVSCLGLIWIWQRLRSSQRQREVIALFWLGLQTYLVAGFLWEPFSNHTLFAKISPILMFYFGQNYLLAGSLLIFPYLLLWVWITDWFWHKGWHLLSRTGESLILVTGAVLPIVNIGTPLSLLIDLLASTAILAHLTLRHLPVRSSYIYLTHLGGLATIFAALAYRWDWCRSIASNFVSVASTNHDPVLDLTVIAIALSILSVGELWLSAQPARRESDPWLHSTWDIGVALAMFTYGCLVMLTTFPAAQAVWPIWWSIVPVAFTYVAIHNSPQSGSVSQRLKSPLVLQSPPTRTNRTQDIELTEPDGKSPLQPWQIANQSQAAWYAIGGLGAGLLLTLNRSEWRSILLILAVGLMFPLVKRLKQLPAAVIHIGFGLGLVANLLDGHIFPTSYWLAIGALTCSGLWFASKKLPQIYAVASDRWAIGLAGLGLAIGSVNYADNELSWLYGKNVILSNSLGLASLQSTLADGMTQWYQSIHFVTLLAIGILVAAMVSRRRWHSSIPATTWFWGLNWAIQIGIAALVHLLGGNTLALAIVNVLLAFPVWIWTHRQIAPTSKLLPVLIAGWGLLLRLPFFDPYTGLLTLAVGVVGILTSRRLSHKSIGYGGMLLVTLGCYELVTHYILHAPSGGSIADALTMYGFMTALLALGYRLGVWWRSKQGADLWWNFPLTGLKNVAHIHWAVASTWKVAAATIPAIPLPKLTLLHLSISAILGGYALIQARDREGGDWWIYLGLAELLGVGIYARSIFQNLGVVDEGLILIACTIGLFVILAPWRQWGWDDRPWRLFALGLPLSRVVFELDRLSLLNLVVLAVFYAGVARRQRQFGWAYLSLGFINWAGMRLLFQYQLTSPLWYATLVGLSILAAVQWDPYWQNSRQNRHRGRIFGSGTIAVTALVWHQPWLPIGIGLAIAIVGIIFRVRAWLYVGTIAFLLTNTYQLLILITEYPITKWAIGLLAGVLIITLAANFERRKEQIERALQHWLDRLQEWE
jgi:hypothetical protein